MKIVFQRLLNSHSRQCFVNGGGFFVATFILMTLGGVHPAMALSSTVGDVLCNVSDNMVPFLDVFNMIAYVASGVFMIQGMLHLRNHHEEPRQYPHHKTFALFTAGTLLTLLPSVIDTLSSTLFTNEGDGGGITSCQSNQEGPTTLSSGSSGQAIDSMLTNFVNDIAGPLTQLVSVVAIVLGAFLIVRGLMKAAKYGTDPRQHSISHIMINLIIGTILISTCQGVDTLMASVFGDSSISEYSDIGWSYFTTLGPQFKAAVVAALAFFQLVGLISFVRGWNIIRNAVEGNGQVTFAQGLTHVIGGVLAINIYAVLQILDTTMGTNFLT